MLSRLMKLKSGGKKIKRDQLIIFFLAGLLLLVMALPAGEKDEDGEDAGNLPEGEEILEDDYVEATEKRLEEVLSQIEGAGQVTVMLTLASSAEKVVEKDVEREEETVTEEDSQGGSRTTESQVYREEGIYGEDDAEGQSPYVSKEISPEVEGVVVIAPGGDDAVVVKNITESVQALFGIDTHKIRIVKGRREEQ